MKPRLSIIVVSWNSRADLALCLPSLMAQTYTLVELIIVDNASEDDSAEFVRQTYPAVRLIENSDNVGFAAATNQGFAAATGDILIGLNPDTTVAPDWLNQIVAAFDCDSVGLVTPRILQLDQPDQINACGNEPSLTGLTFCIGVNAPAHTYDAKPIQSVPAISGAAFAISRACYEATGGFDGSYFTYYEDTDLSFRARLAGFEIKLAPEAIVYHAYSFRMSPRKLYWIERNRHTTLIKCLRGRTLLRLSPALLLGEAISWGFALLNGWRTVLAKAQAFVWVMRSYTLIERSAERDHDHRLIQEMVTHIRFDQATSPQLSRFLNRLCQPFLSLNKRIVLYLP